MSEKLNKAEILRKHGVNLALLVDTDNPLCNLEWDKAVTRARELRKLLDDESPSPKDFRQSSHTVDDKSAQAEAEAVFATINSAIVNSGILDNPEALSHLGNLLKGFNHSVDSVIEHHLSLDSIPLELANYNQAPVYKSTIIDEYIVLREILLNFGVMFGPFDKQQLTDLVPPKSGKYGNGVALAIPCRFYDYTWEVTRGGQSKTFRTEKWWEVADFMGYQVFPRGGGTIHYADFQDWLKEEFELDLNRIHLADTAEFQATHTDNLGRRVYVTLTLKAEK